MDIPHLAWHLSGGTTELLLVEPDGRNVKCTRIGGTTDISAGQLIDRTGQMLSLPFPSGKHIDKLSASATSVDLFRVKCKDSEFSLSGVQNKIAQHYGQSEDPAETAAYCLRCVAHAVRAATENALKKYNGLPVVFSGGVASNSLLRTSLEDLNPVFSKPEYSTDNAMGIAVLTYRALEG
jgi:N6-L-threonylcarbamoyladenine synthase